MREVEKLWPAWVVGAVAGALFGTCLWIGTVSARGYGSSAKLAVVAVAAGLLAGLLIGRFVASQRDKILMADGLALTKSERVVVANVIRHAAHTDDPRLNAVAARIVRRGQYPFIFAIYGTVVLGVLLVGFNGLGARFWYVFFPSYLVVMWMGRKAVSRRRAAYLAASGVGQS
jgi:hypothetical protein